MRAIGCWTMAVVLWMSLIVSAGCAAPVKPEDTGKMPLVFQADFEDGKLDGWQATDPAAWRIERREGNKVLSLFGKGNYKPKVRSPRNINIIQDANVAGFELELKMLSTKEYNPRRDLCVFFGYQDPTHFYYAHIAEKSDKVHNMIYIVDDAPRTSITGMRNEGNSWRGGWHKVKLIRDVDKGTIEVYFDDMSRPVMTAVDKRFKWGRIGVGSFDDTGQFDDIRLWGRKVID